MMQLCFTEILTDMERFNSAFESFGAFVCEKRDWKSCEISFDEYCRKHCCDKAVLNALLKEELGMTGEEILTALRNEMNGLG